MKQTKPLINCWLVREIYFYIPQIQHLVLFQDDLQVPSTIRPKLAGMESSVKAAMLKSSQTLSSASSPTVGRALRKAHSSDSLSPPHIFKHSVDHDDTNAPIAERLAGTAVPAESSMTHSRGMSVDSPRPKSRASVPFGNSGETAFKSKTKDKSSKNAWTPVKFCSFLDNTSSSLLEVEVVKKLRLFLRNEAARFVLFFLQVRVCDPTTLCIVGQKSFCRRVDMMLFLLG